MRKPKKESEFNLLRRKKLDKEEIRKKVLDFLTKLYQLEEDSYHVMKNYTDKYEFCMKSVQHEVAVNQLHMIILFSQLLGIEAHYKCFGEVEVKNWGVLGDNV